MAHVDSSQVTPLYSNTTPGLTADANVFDPAVAAMIVAINENFDSFEAFKAAVTLPIPDQSIVTNHLRNLAVTNAKLAPLAVTADKIADGSITLSKLADLVITAAKIANGTITESKYATGSVSSRAIGTGEVKAPNLDPTLLTQYGTIATNAKFELIDAQLASIVHMPAASNGVDDTAMIQSVIDSTNASGGGTVQINAAYLINDTGLKAKSFVNILGTPLGSLNKIPTSSTFYTIIDTSGATDIVIESLKIIGDRLTHIGTTGEQGHGIFISSGSKRIKVIDPDISNCWGDGIYVGSATGTANIEDIDLIRVKSSNNRRLGIAVTDVKNLLIEDPYLTSMVGTAPMSGLDIEPNSSTARLENIHIKGGYYGQNGSSGLVMALANMAGSANEVSITVDGGNYVDNSLTVYHAPGSKGYVRLNKPNILRGKLNLQRCYADSIEVRVDEPEVIDYSLTETISQRYSSGILIGVDLGQVPLGTLGGITINNPRTKTSRSTAFGGINFGDYNGTGATIKDVIVKNYRCSGGLSDICINASTVFDNVTITPDKSVLKKISAFSVVNSNTLFNSISAEQSSIFSLWTNFPLIPVGVEVEYVNSSTNGVNLRFGTNTVTATFKVGVISPGTAVNGLTTTVLGAKIKLKRISSDTILITEILGTWTAIP